MGKKILINPLALAVLTIPLSVAAQNTPKEDESEALKKRYFQGLGEALDDAQREQPAEKSRKKK